MARPSLGHAHARLPSLSKFTVFDGLGVTITRDLAPKAVDHLAILLALTFGNCLHGLQSAAPSHDVGNRFWHSDRQRNLCSPLSSLPPPDSASLLLTYEMLLLLPRDTSPPAPSPPRSARAAPPLISTLRYYCTIYFFDVHGLHLPMARQLDYAAGPASARSAHAAPPSGLTPDSRPTMECSARHQV